MLVIGITQLSDVMLMMKDKVLTFGKEKSTLFENSQLKHIEQHLKQKFERTVEDELVEIQFNKESQKKDTESDYGAI